ncbi:anthranilate synthase component I [Lentisphaera profundi]|uniref:Anthranilate synthase component 1 n=1 Tax=Lentisphaera profundi TaxID=1658616 RepID=A0ABY7VRG9_9BACT|nr:anthranilate synthase component I [Lentisphaera profundi]WDE96795.1 anthranilate synthase component I [Lentisphaera profundi]
MESFLEESLLANIHPSKDSIKILAKKGTLIPIYTELIADLETPISAFSKIAYDESGKKKPYAFLLESADGGENIGRYSFMGVDPLALISRRGDIVELSGAETSTLEVKEDTFKFLENYLKRYDQVELEGLAPFSGGAVGYASYETIQEIEPRVQCKNKEDFGTPDALFGIYETIVSFDRLKQRIQVISHIDLKKDDLEQGYKKALNNIAQIVKKLGQDRVAKPLVLNLETEPLEAQSNMTREEFCKKVLTAKEYIRSGDVIQVVLSQRFEVDVDPEPLDLMRTLRMINPSPYMFCLHLGDDFSLVGASPEVHAKAEDGLVTVRPIAGTRKRGRNKAEDDALAEDLLADPKERAEHIMLVDLARNDVGRIAETGSVDISQLMIIEKYSHVLHIVSEVRGKLQQNFGPGSVMSSTFPAGTVSGAPKIRAMEIISELEPDRRGAYAGAVTYFSFNGNVDSCIAIRTAVLKDGKVYVQAGAGVVADSDPVYEYEETGNKARAMLVALNTASKMSAENK